MNPKSGQDVALSLSLSLRPSIALSLVPSVWPSLRPHLLSAEQAAAGELPAGQLLGLGVAQFVRIAVEKRVASRMRARRGLARTALQKLWHRLGNRPKRLLQRQAGLAVSTGLSARLHHTG